MHDNYVGLSASMGSQLLHLFNKLDKIVGQQLGLLKGSKVTTSRHESVGVDVFIANLCP